MCSFAAHAVQGSLKTVKTHFQAAFSASSLSCKPNISDYSTMLGFNPTYPCLSASHRTDTITRVFCRFRLPESGFFVAPTF
ncbi:hypothetical protein HMPREF9123_2238 [Neisseria bacilliformis ATCC BAA-1200]|uniref:Uncharacterized protein n=1 Tax=Neisseria bacilliformis ATCC BAA-1200 TaxID=888742 RepID=F2BET1_9NEIS|nr:hypothetical protein HMPREF9123_2238 [Neisseria bacilliformis ATCC BAA-1200]